MKISFAGPIGRILHQGRTAGKNDDWRPQYGLRWPFSRPKKQPGRPLPGSIRRVV